MLVADSSSGPSAPVFDTGFSDDNVVVGGTDALAGASGVGGSSGSSGVPLSDWWHAEVCGTYSASRGYRWPCADGRVRDHSDVCGTDPVVLPLWQRTRTSATSEWSAWQFVRDVTCVQEQVPTDEQVLREFRRLPIVASVLHVQPDASSVLVHMDTIAFADPSPQVLSATVVGVQVEFVVSPVSYSWDFGQDAVFTTTSPGHPWPDQDVAHAYGQPGTGQITLTTTWGATYTLGEDPVARPVPGTATTTSTSAPFEIVELHSQLVAGPCTQYPNGPGCP
jgi:hypothetical protein